MISARVSRSTCQTVSSTPGSSRSSSSSTLPNKSLLGRNTRPWLLYCDAYTAKQQQFVERQVEAYSVSYRVRSACGRRSDASADPLSVVSSVSSPPFSQLNVLRPSSVATWNVPVQCRCVDCLKFDCRACSITTEKINKRNHRAEPRESRYVCI